MSSNTVEENTVNIFVFPMANSIGKELRVFFFYTQIQFYALAYNESEFYGRLILWGVVVY